MADPITSRSRRGVSASAAAATDARGTHAAPLALPRRAGRRRSQYAFVRADAAWRLARTRDLHVLLRVAHAHDRLEKRRADGRRVRLRQLRDAACGGCTSACMTTAGWPRRSRVRRSCCSRCIWRFIRRWPQASGRSAPATRAHGAAADDNRRSRRPGMARWRSRAPGRSANGCAARCSPAFRGSRAAMRRWTVRSPDSRRWRACMASAGCWRWWPR